MDLDTRLRSAGASLHRAVDVIPADTPPHPAPSRRPILAAAAAVLLVVAIVGMAVALRDGEEGVSSDPDDVPRLIVDDPPGGLVLTGVADLPVELDEQLGMSGWFALYQGDGADVAVLVVPDDGQEGDGRHVTARGHDAVIEEIEPFGTTVSWVESEGVLAMVATHSLSEDQIVDVAEALTFDGDTARLSETPAGIDAVLQETAAIPDFTLGLGLPGSASAGGHIAGYQEDLGEGEMRTASVGLVTGTDSDLAAQRWMTGADERITVRGHDGWIGETEYGTSVVWQEGPGLLGVVQGYGVTRDEVLAIVGGLRPATSDEWETGLRASESPTPHDDKVSIEGEYGQGTWSAYIDADGELCGGIEKDGQSTGSCGELDGADLIDLDDVESIEGQDRPPLAVYGVLPDGAISVTTSDGPMEVKTATADDGTAIYAIDLQGKPVPVEVIFLDAAGKEVSRTSTLFDEAEVSGEIVTAD
jgi:hypothetical protein